MARNKDTHTSENLKGCHLLSLPVITTLKVNCHPCILDEKCIMLHVPGCPPVSSRMGVARGSHGICPLQASLPFKAPHAQAGNVDM